MAARLAHSLLAAARRLASVRGLALRRLNMVGSPWR